MNELFTTAAPAVVTSDRALYTASSFARSSLLHLQEIGNLEAKRLHTSERSGLNSFLFFIVTYGSGTLTYDRKAYELSPNSCVFIDCRRPYSHTTKPDDLWHLSWCHFFGPTLSSIYEKYCERGGRAVFVPDDVTVFLDVLSKLKTISKSSDNMRDMLINEQLSTLIRVIMANSWHPEDKRQAPKRTSVAEVKNYLDSKYAEKITLDALSAQFYIDKYYLVKSFKNQYGMTITNYIQNMRITKAKQLIRFSDKTIEEIGAEVGIDNPAYFSRVFKEIEGVSPRIYREQW